MSRLITPVEKVYRATGLWVPRPLRFAGRRCCCGLPCAACYGTLADNYQAVVAGIVSVPPKTCNCLNDIFMLTTAAAVSGGLSCSAGYLSESAFCDTGCGADPNEPNTVWIKFIYNGVSEHYFLEGHIGSQWGSYWKWEHDYGINQPPCRMSDAIVLNPVIVGNAWEACCDHSAATFTVSRP